MYSCCSRAKTVNENLKMNAALLSRFDLVFILLDKPDEVLDKRVSDHIMAVSYCSLLSLKWARSCHFILCFLFTVKECSVERVSNFKYVFNSMPS